MDVDQTTAAATNATKTGRISKGTLPKAKLNQSKSPKGEKRHKKPQSGETVAVLEYYA